MRSSLRNKIAPDRPQQLRMFTLCLRQYVYSSELGTFLAVPPMPSHLPAQICKALDALKVIASGAFDQQLVHKYICHAEVMQ